MGFVFKQCARQCAVQIAKAKGKKANTLNRLRSFLDAEEPHSVEWLMNTWKSQQNAITYKELRETILSGDITEEQLAKWQKSYAKLVNTKLAPQWAQAMEAAAADRIKQFHGVFFRYDQTSAAQAYIQKRGAELVTNLAAEQRQALRAMISHAVTYDAMTADSLSRMMRPVIGLTTPQAKANLKYYNAVRSGLLEANPKMKPETAEKKAREASEKYAARQQRYRAMTIARTELAMAYNQGSYDATRDAIDKGYIGNCKKTWLTADDERVCSECGGLDGESVNIDAPFSDGSDLPPAHPNCRCAVAFDEIAGSLMPTAEPLSMETATPTPLPSDEPILISEPPAVPVPENVVSPTVYQDEKIPVFDTDGGFASEKSQEIISNQKPLDSETINRVKNALAKKGVVLDQSAKWDKYLVTNNKEAITFTDGTIVLHTKVSASGFFEELIHYGQIKNGRTEYGNELKTLMLEIEAKERLIRNQSAYRITDYEIEVLKKTLDGYILQLEKLRRGGT